MNHDSYFLNLRGFRSKSFRPFFEAPKNEEKSLDANLKDAWLLLPLPRYKRKKELKLKMLPSSGRFLKGFSLYANLMSSLRATMIIFVPLLSYPQEHCDAMIALFPMHKTSSQPGKLTIISNWAYEPSNGCNLVQQADVNNYLGYTITYQFTYYDIVKMQ